GGVFEVDPSMVGLTVGAGERLVYSNTLGQYAISLPTNSLISDDIATTSKEGCAIKRFTFQVTGRVDPTGTGGPFTVTYGLYLFCPGSLPSSMRLGLLIPGTGGQVVLPDDLAHT